MHYLSQVQYAQSKAAKMSKVRDLPQVSGRIIWSRQVSNSYKVLINLLFDWTFCFVMKMLHMQCE